MATREELMMGGLAAVARALDDVKLDANNDEANERNVIRYVVTENGCLFAMTREQYIDMLCACANRHDVNPQEHGGLHIGWVELTTDGRRGIERGDALQRLGQIYAEKRGK